MKSSSKLRITQWMTGLVALVILVTVACGGAAAPAAPVAPAATKASAAAAAPAATAAPQVMEKAKSARDTATVVTEAEPASVGAWSEGCSAEIHSIGCQDFVSDYITWIDDRNDFEVVLLSGFESYEQMAPDRWRFKLRPGVKFHNGEPWNAEAAKFGIDYNADPTNASASITWTGPIKPAEVVDEFTMDVVCGAPCPIYPRTGIFTDFQAPKWFQAASEADRSRMTNAFGPYRIIDYQPGIHTKFEAYPDYLPNENFFSQAAVIPFITHVYRSEATVRAAMVATGEADWVADIGFEEAEKVPKWVSGTTAEVYTLILDTVFHPELKKQKVRLALAHAIDCQGLLDSLFQGRIKCWGAISMEGTVGITPENSAVREYNPELSRQLLKEAGYDPVNSIDVNTRPGSNIRGLEIMEATVTYWRDVGVTSELNSWGDLAKAREVQTSGCGRFYKLDETFKDKLDCDQRDPPGPYFTSSHAYEVATSNEILDQQRFNNSRMNCSNRSSRVCRRDLQEQAKAANAVPAGPERRKAMEAMLDIAYEEVFFIPFMQVEYVYGLSEDIEWQPYYAPRLRGNTMSFTK